MTARRPETSFPDRTASRRDFFKLLAASPLLGVGRVGPARELAACARA